MIAAIEEAIIARLTAKAQRLAYVDIPKGGSCLVAGPSYMLSTRKGEASNPCVGSLKQSVSLSLWLVVPNLRGDAARRKGAYPLIEAVSQLLFLETLELDIAPLKYTGFIDVTEPEELAAGIGIYQLDFSTSYTVRKAEEAESVQLLTLGMSFLLNGEKPAILEQEVNFEEA